MINMIGVLSDAHGNYYAFDLALKILREQGVSEIFFLGDAIGYIPTSNIVEHLLNMDEHVVCVRGNHEDMFLHGNWDARHDHIYQLSRTQTLMNKDCSDFIATWKISYLLNKPVGKLLFIHGSPGDPTNGYVYKDSDLSVFNTDADYVFMGHSHHPFVRQYKKTTFINVGSCGLPRDNGKYGSVALFDVETGFAKIIRFDIGELSAKVLIENPSVHGVVAALFERKIQKLYGEIYE